MHKNVIRMVRVALLAAVLCAVSPFSVAIGPIPLSFASLGVYFAVGLLGLGEGTAAVSLYVLLGAVGVPVFAGFAGGFQRIAGPTGGYIVGYIACAVVAGLLWRRSSSPWRLALALLAGTVALYALGTVWYVLQSGVAVGSALLVCVVPFLPGDAIKIAVCCGVIPPLRSVLEKHGFLG